MVELLVQMINLCNNSRSDLNMSQETWQWPQYRHLCDLTSEICVRLDRLRKQNVRVNGHHGHDRIINDPAIVRSMQELVKLVFSGATHDDDNFIDRDVRMTFFEVTRGFYYSAHCNESTMDQHVVKVLSDSVL